MATWSRTCDPSRVHHVLGRSRSVGEPCFGPYRPDGYTGALAVANLHEHLDHPAFRRDVVDLVRSDAAFDADAAAALVIDELISRIDAD